MLADWTVNSVSWILIIEIMLAGLVGYLLILMLAALIAPKRTSFPAHYIPRTRFAILVPAHDEERLLPDLLNSLQAQNYPSNLFDTYIVADNCSDLTAEIGKAKQANVYERRDNRWVGKGYALNWLYKELQLDGLADGYAAFVIFDADTVVDEQFLRVMDSHLQAGETAIQGYYSVRDPGRSWGTALRYAALAVLHYLRPLGRNLLHGTAGLKGNGMCFAAEVYRSREWSGAITEDIEYHMNLILDGKRVFFAPDAWLAAEMPGLLNQAYTQNLRWEGGRLEMVRRYAFPLLKMAFLKPSFVAFDALMEHLIPPISLLVLFLFATTLLGLVIGILGGSWGALWFSISLLAALVLYLVAGLYLVHAPKQVWLAFFHAPEYVLWKVGLFLRLSSGKGPQGWIRTGR